MAIESTPRTPFLGFLFRIEIDGITSAAFRDCSEIGGEFGVIEHYEGGSRTPLLLPGKLKFKPLTLSRGATLDDELNAWFEQVHDVESGAGVPDPEFRKNGDVVQLNEDGSVAVRWRFTGAWPSAYTAASGLDNNGEDVTIESVTLQVQTIKRVPG